MKITQLTLPDEQDQIENTLKLFSDKAKIQCILTTGGTGFAPRDVTPEATRNVIIKECPQLAHMMLLEGLKKTPFAALSRAVCGVRNSTLIVNFPGSKKAVVECFDAIKDLIPHAVELICDEKAKSEKKHEEIQAVEVENQLLSDGEDAGDENQSEVVEKDPVEPKKIGNSLSDLLRAQGIDLDAKPAGKSSEKAKKPLPSKPKAASAPKIPQASKNAPKTSKNAPKSPQTSRKEREDIFDATFKATTMEELHIDDSLASLNSSLAKDPPEGPKRHVCPHKTANPGEKMEI